MNIENLHFICKYKSGSSLYNTRIENSDTDWCGIFIDKKTNIQSLTTLIPSDDKDKTIDEKFVELRTYLEDVANGDIFKMEPLYIDKYLIDEHSKELDFLRNNKEKLIDSLNIFKWTLNYCAKELFWANSPTGLNGQIRHPKMQEIFNIVGFDNRAFGHAMTATKRITWFFKESKFIVDIKNKDIDLYNLIIDIKKSPRKFSPQQLNDIVDEYIFELRESFNNRATDFKVNIDIVKQIANNIYVYH